MATKRTRSSQVKSIRKSDKTLTQAIPRVVKLWALRILVPLDGFKKLDHSSDLLLKELSIKEELEQFIDEDFDYDIKKVKSVLSRIYAETETALSAIKPPSKLVKSVKRLANLVGLSDVECRLLEFAVLIHSEQVLDGVGDCLGMLSTAQVVKVLSIVLALPRKEVEKALNNSGVLSRSGLLSLERGGPNFLLAKMELLSSSFADRILMADEDPIHMLQDIITKSPSPALSISDYSHLDQSLKVLIPYLERSLETGRRGVNIFLHGPPGTGKTQLARVITKELAGELFDVTSQDNDGDPVDGEQRLRAYRAAQCFFAKKNALLMFDEAEDVFSDGGGPFGRKSTAQTKKGWLNAALEECSVPTIWAANSIDGIDAAFIRRFDLVLELPIPPRIQREKIIRNSCGDILEEESIKRLSASEFLAPAVVTRAASVTRAIQDLLPCGEIPKAVEMLINSSLYAQSRPQVSKKGDESLSLNFDPFLVNTSSDLIEVAQGLKTIRSGRLCLYGPPGTGKTAFGRWLADQIGVPLHVKRASDLLSMYVGEQEKNIAQCFARAEKEGALLMLDEVDSFLQNRSGASRSWEVTSVNEVLTQMENFQGIFVASTNLIDNIDQAAFRRFDLKLMFDYLSQNQSWALFVRRCAELGFGEPKSKHRTQLQIMKSLTPGDFAAVMRRNRFSKIACVEDLLTALGAECAVKADQGRKQLGF